MRSNRRHGLRRHGGRRAVHLLLPIGNSWLPADPTDRFLGNVDEPVVAWKDPADSR
jgi:hypothetical protein